MKKEKMQRYDQLEDAGRKKRRFWKVLVTIILRILLSLCFRSCQARDEPLPTPDRIYEEDYTPSYEDVIPSEGNKRLSLAISYSYRITDENPVFYIGFPEENIFDVVLTIRDTQGQERYKTNYIALRINVLIRQNRIPLK